MSDWQQPPGPGGWPPAPASPAPAGQPPAPTPASSGGPTVTFGQIWASYRVLLRRSMPGVAMVFAGLALANLVFNVPAWIVQYLQLQALSTAMFGDVGSLAIVGSLTNLLRLVATVAIVSIRVGLSRPIRALLVEGPDAVKGAGPTLKMATQRFWPVLGTTLLVGLAIAVGLILCVLPGLAAMFLLMMAPYLVSACEADVGSAFKRSYTLATRNIGPFLGVIGIAVGGVLVLLGVSVAMNAVVVSMLGFAAVVFVQPVVLILGEALGFLWWLLFGAAFVTAETADSGVQVRL
ncbi:MAG: hypothetical protein HYY06_28955 [Deltaproteobacteria bacterium]|nr:hypothetical protein [Deltaproteobacteria bacterium]